ncbi:MAG TPA: alginate export family protein, partial [Ferruginibacter sp.]|nr:alginate export family protein [Ferruginibacter sp.]
KEGDDQLNTFNPLFPRGAYFGYAAIIGPANLFDAHPSFAVPVAAHLVLDIDADLFYRYSKADGIYGPNAAMIYPGKGSNQKRIGEQYSMDLIYTPNVHLYMRGELTFFKAGPYLKDVSAGKNILFAGVTTEFKF